MDAKTANKQPKETQKYIITKLESSSNPPGKEAGQGCPSHLPSA